MGKVFFLVMVFFLASSTAFGHGNSHSEESTAIIADNTVSVVMGGVSRIDVLTEDILELYDADSLVVKILSIPVEGIASVDPKNQQIVYRHGGASSSDDVFTYQVIQGNTAVSNEASITVQFRQINASIEILSPTNGAVISGNQIVVEYRVLGDDFDHIHVNIDHSHNTVEDRSGRYVFNEVAPGEHVISVDLSNAQHRVVNSRQSRDEIAITVVAE